MGVSNIKREGRYRGSYITVIKTMHDHPSEHAERAEHGRWARLSWCVVLAQLPAVAALAFNLWASLLALLLDGLGRAAARQACRRSSVQEQDTKDAKDAKDSKEKDVIQRFYSTGFKNERNDKGSRDALLPLSLLYLLYTLSSIIIPQHTPNHPLLL